ncbi:MAG: hypothetical protein V4502_09010 [Pseudomonadota bacterium]
MTKLSVSKAWDESKQVIAHDGRLLVPVALAMFVLPGILVDLVVPEGTAGQLPPAGPWIAAASLAALVSLVGQLAVIRLAMGPHLTVGEALSHGARRLLPYLAAVLMWMLPFLVLGVILFGQIAADPAKPSPGAALAFLALVIVMTFVAVRLILTSSIASAEAIGPVAILGRSWALTKGNWWRLFGFFLAFMIGAIVLFWATESVFGMAANLVFGGTEANSVAWLLVRLVAQLLSALISVIFFVMLARIYRQLAGVGEAQPSVPSTGI